MIDNSYVITEEGCIGVIIGNKHTKKGFFGLISYIPLKFLKKKAFSKDYCRTLFGEDYVKVSDLYIKNWKKNSYDKAQKLISNLFPQYDYKDTFWGHINFFPKNKIIKIIEKGDYKDKDNHKALKQVKNLFKLKNEEFDLISTKSFGPNPSSDFDIMIKGFSIAIRVRDKIRKLLQSPKNQFITPIGTPHTRIFLFKGNKIDPFFKYKEGEDPLGDFSYKVGDYRKVRDKVVDDSHSIFTPAIYKLKKNGFLLSYFTKHKGLLKNDDIIEFRAKEIKLNSLKFSGKGFVISPKGEWIKILK